MQLKALFFMVVLCISISFYSCGNDPSLEDGDSDINKDGDTELEDETSDGDIEDEITDGDIDEEVTEVQEDDSSEGEDDIEENENNTLTCDNPYPIPTDQWQPQNTYSDAKYRQEQGFLFEKDVFSKGINGICKAGTSSIYMTTNEGVYKVTESGEATKIEVYGLNAFHKIATDGESLFLSYQDTLFIGDETQILNQYTCPANISKIIITNGNEPWVMTETQAVGHVVKGTTGVEWYNALSSMAVNDLCKAGDNLYLATDTGLYSFNVGTLTANPVFDNYESWPTNILTAVQCDANGPVIVALKDNGLATLFDGQADFIDGTDGLPCMSIIDINGDLSDGNERLLLTTDIKTVEVEQSSETKLTLTGGLGLATVLLGHLDGTTENKWEYYNSKYWIPDNTVIDAVLTDENNLFVATAKGLGIIKASQITLEDKATVIDEGQYSRHNRFGMFSRCALTTPGDLSTAKTVDDDNDGQWTNQYLASQCFRYAVTKDEQAKQYADEAANAMLRLLTITGKKGFFARSVLEPDTEATEGNECAYITQGEWHLSNDKQWCWKGDTSKDEYVGHIFGLSLYYDLVADESQKTKVRDAFVDLHDGIIANGYYLEDIDGECTTHGQFDPFFMSVLGIFGDAGLNSASFLGGLYATYHMSGEQRFMDAFNYLAFDEGYAEYVRKIEEINLKAHTNHDAEEMSFLALATLMRYETEPCLMAMWREGLEYLWEVQRPEKDPEFNMIYAWLSRNEPNDLENSVNTLKQMHMNGIKWPVYNSYRSDYTLDEEKDRFKMSQSTEIFPYNQRVFPRWSENPYRLDYHNGGTTEEMLQTWLLPYWLGRYLGVIVPETE